MDRFGTGSPPRQLQPPARSNRTMPAAFSLSLSLLPYSRPGTRFNEDRISWVSHLWTPGQARSEGSIRCSQRPAHLEFDSLVDSRCGCAFFTWFELHAKSDAAGCALTLCASERYADLQEFVSNASRCDLTGPNRWTGKSEPLRDVCKKKRERGIR